MNAVLLSFLVAAASLWQVSYDSLGIHRLVAPSDPYEANLIEGGRLGQVLVPPRQRRDDSLVTTSRARNLAYKAVNDVFSGRCLQL